MIIDYDGREYTFDLEEITLRQADIIKAKTGLTLMKLEDSLSDGDPAGLRAIYWLMLIQNGEKVDIDRVDCKIVKFARAIDEAGARASAEAEADPKGEDGATSQP